MGLDSFTMFATLNNVPIKVELLDSTTYTKTLPRATLNALCRLISENDVMKHKTHRMVYEVDISIIDEIKEHDEVQLDAFILHRMNMFFSEFKTGISYEELSKLDPLNGRPIRMMEGIRFFIMFEG